MIAILTPLLYQLGPLAVVLVMAVVFAETGLLFGFFLPGDSLLFLAGALVASHVIALPFWVLAAGVFVAAVLGDQLGYLIGRRYGPRVFSRPESRFFRRENAERAQLFFARRGALAVVLGRFVPVVRTFVPIVAGVARMPRRSFSFLNLVGALVWAVGIVAVGFLFGGIAFVAAHIELITIAIASVSIIPATFEVLRRRRRTTPPSGGRHHPPLRTCPCSSDRVSCLPRLRRHPRRPPGSARRRSRRCSPCRRASPPAPPSPRPMTGPRCACACPLEATTQPLPEVARPRTVLVRCRSG